MLNLTFSVMGTTQLNRSLSRFGEAVRDFRPVWRQLYADFLKIEREQFNSEGARSGTPWRPLRPTYAAWKAVHYPGMKVLVATGTMQLQLTTGQGMQNTFAPLSMRLHPTDPKAKYHQAGTRRMAARPPVQLTPDDKTRWVKILHDYVYRATKGTTK
jgi:phage gpG-like protein